MVDQHPWPQTEGAQLPARLPHDDTPNLERPLPDDDVVANVKIQLGQQFRTHQRSPARQQAMTVRAAVLQHEFPIERKRRLHPPQLDHLRDGLRFVRRARHCRHLDRRSTRDARLGRHRRVDQPQGLFGPGLVRFDQDVGRGQRPSLGRHRDPHALDHRAKRHDGADANCHTEEKEGQPAP